MNDVFQQLFHKPYKQHALKALWLALDDHIAVRFRATDDAGTCTEWTGRCLVPTILEHGELGDAFVMSREGYYWLCSINEVSEYWDPDDNEWIPVHSCLRARILS